MMKVEKTKGSILTARPDGMDYETYREARKQQQKMIKNRIRYGFMVWPSKGFQGKGTLVGNVPAVEFE